MFICIVTDARDFTNAYDIVAFELPAMDLRR